MPVNVGDALKSQKKGLKLDVTRMGYLRRTVVKIERVSVWRDIYMQKHIETVRGGNYLLNGPGG